MTLKKALMILAAGAILSGCITQAAVLSKEGKAYVVSGHIFGTKMYVCDATDGNPECWPVDEQERE
jgi:hypothetical protein